MENNYPLAVREYIKEMRVKPLTNQQYCNMAEAYLKMENYEQASLRYSEVYERDSVLPAYHLNKMLQAFKMTGGLGSVREFLQQNPGKLSPELVENALLNIDLQSSSGDTRSTAKIFNLNNNSPFADFAPSFYRDQLLFTSARGSESQRRGGADQPSSFLNIFNARLDNKGDAIGTRTFSNIPSFDYHQGTPFYSEDLDAVFYIRSNEANGNLVFDEYGKNSLALGSADKNGNFRFLLKDLSISFYYPYYETESGKLYFAANFEGGYGGTDLYFVYTNNGLIMSSPVNLGPHINTPGNEIAPYIFEGSLYFASDIFYGLGGMDSYKSEILEDNEYSIPVNLGRDLNSEKDDFGLIIQNYQENSLIGYFASNRPGGKGSDDLYGFVIDDKPGIKTFTLYGSVVNLSTNDRISQAEVRLLDQTGKVLKEVITDDRGAFRIEVPWQESIKVQAAKGRHSTFSESFLEDDLQTIQGTPFNMGIVSIDDLVEETEDQAVLKLNKFYFDKGRSTITPEIAQELDKVVDAVARFPQLQLRIESHTDSRGGSATNFRISQSRADAIKNYLENNGVSPSNILYSIGYGEDKLLNDCTDGAFCMDSFHKKNERQLIVVLNYDLLF
ncbi:OmpA family protein [Muriicola marianensis]|uniref:Cell envelope biogenesis protein OmpA n=1 Tax=Muriicola marianensis TaxID=1324801 RepID=A0ABQ1QVV9_9FLAO|nr:OmpA family protein [Muriicola marianensis]GGD46040.1 cell envelope biogenesis protein OmpA [Muriicola marianensis]